MNVSIKVKKAICYTVMNIGISLFSAMEFLQGVSATRSLIVFLGSLVWINFLVWFMFRMLSMRSPAAGASNPREDK
jgi:hypothetical protein